MKVHREIDDPRLEVIGNLIDDHLGANIDKLDISQIRLFNGLIHFLIVPNSLPEIPRRFFRVLTNIVRRGSLNLQDITHDKVFVIALALNEKNIIALSVTTFFNPLPPMLSRVSGIKDSNVTALLLKPAEHVSNGSLSSSTAKTLSLRIASVEKFGRRVRSIRTTVGANIERFGVNREPFEVTNDCRRKISEPIERLVFLSFLPLIGRFYSLPRIAVFFLQIYTCGSRQSL